jgi:hypothetical protein
MAGALQHPFDRVGHRGIRLAQALEKLLTLEQRISIVSVLDRLAALVNSVHERCVHLACVRM